MDKTIAIFLGLIKKYLNTESIIEFIKGCINKYDIEFKLELDKAN